MCKKIRKVSTILLSVILSFSFMNVAFAKEAPKSEPRSITTEPEGIVIKVDSQKEYDELVQEIKERNALANKLWEEADTRVVSNEPVLVKDLATLSSTYGSTNYSFRFKKNKIALILRYDTSTTGGVKRFVNVHNFLVVPHTNKNDISVKDIFWDYKFLDSYRTVAVNTSFIVSIQGYTGTYANYDVTKYVEYYASGGSYGS